MSASQTGDVIRYIKNQAALHAKKSFEQEFLEFLERYGITYAPAHVLGVMASLPGTRSFVAFLRDAGAPVCLGYPALKRRAKLCRPCGTIAGARSNLSSIHFDGPATGGGHTLRRRMGLRHRPVHC